MGVGLNAVPALPAGCVRAITMMDARCKMNLTREQSYLRLFQQVTGAITSTLDVDEVLQLIVRKVPEVVGVDAATIRLLEPGGRKLRLLAAHGLSAKYLNRGPVDAESSVTTALAGTPVAIFDTGSDDRIRYSDAARREGIKSILVAPIPIRGRIQGVLRLLTRSPRNFDESEIEFVSALAEQCGIAIENARIYASQQRQLRYFTTLNEIGKTLNSTRNLQEVLDFIVSKLPEVMALKGCTIRLMDPVKGHLELRAASGLSRRYLHRGSINDELSTYRALMGEPVVIYDAASDHRVQYREEAAREGVASILAVPLVVKERIIGILRLLTDHPRHFNDADIGFAMAVAEQGGIAIQNAISYNKISNLVTELEQQEEFLQQVIDNLNADLFVLDNEFRIIMVNRVFLENHNTREEDIIGRPCHEVLRVGKEGEHPARRVIEENCRVIYTQQVEKDGREVYLEVMASPVSIYQEGTTDFIIGTIRDISDHVRLQKEQRARERLQGVLEMAGTAAHELNSPLFSALGTAQLALEDVHADSPLHAEIATIERNLKTMSELLRRMSRITRYESKTYVGDTSIVDIDKSS
jgi:PAS domain S-box-containing protein